MQTIVEVLNKTEAFLAKAGFESPKAEAKWLLAHSLGCKPLELFLMADRPLSDEELGKLRTQLKRRAAGEPLQYIFGFEDFHGLRIPVAPGVLIPRSETEELVDHVLQWIANRCPETTSENLLVAEQTATSDPDPAVRQLKVIDLGTGSGAIALAIAHKCPFARVLAIDASVEALKQARAAAEQLGLRQQISFRRGNWLDDITAKVDLIVANPPYLSVDEWQTARPEVRDHEPYEALVAADDGSADLLHILSHAKDCLLPGGLLAMETGIHHARLLTQYAEKLGYHDIRVLPDLQQRERLFFACA